MPPDDLAKPLRTYQGDIADVLQKNQGSVAKIAIAEVERKEKEPPAETIAHSSSRTKSSFFLLSSFILILGGGYLLYEYYYLPQQHPPSIAPQNLIPSIIAPDTQKGVEVTAGTREAFLGSIQNLIAASNEPLNSIEQIYFITTDTTPEGSTKRMLTGAEFLNKLETNAPAEFIRTLEPDFMFGIHTADGKAPFLILKTNLYQSAFAGMLKWENDLPDDILPLFGTPTAVATTSPQSTADILRIHKPFIDVVIKNKDTRVLTKDSGDVVLLYTFLDRETILITPSEATLKEILDRLTNKRFLR